jgi:hypothetical protein
MAKLTNARPRGGVEVKSSLKAGTDDARKKLL